MRPKTQKLELIDTILRIPEQKRGSSTGEPHSCSGCSKLGGLPTWFLRSGFVHQVFACDICVKRLRREGILVERSSETLRLRVRELSWKAHLFRPNEEERFAVIEAQLATPRRQQLDRRKHAIAELKALYPRLSQFQLCAKMDAKAERNPDFTPLESWKNRLWIDAYRSPSTQKKVQVYLSKIKSWRPK